MNAPIGSEAWARLRQMTPQELRQVLQLHRRGPSGAVAPEPGWLSAYELPRFDGRAANDNRRRA